MSQMLSRCEDIQSVTLKASTSHMEVALDCRSNRQELLMTVSDILALRLNSVRQVQNGATLCQLFHILHPACIDMSQVNFAASAEFECLLNYKLLKKVLDSTGDSKYLLDLVKILRDEEQSWELLKGVFHAVSETAELAEYNAVAERKGSRGGYLRTPAEPSWLQAYKAPVPSVAGLAHLRGTSAIAQEIDGSHHCSLTTKQLAPLTSAHKDTDQQQATCPQTPPIEDRRQAQSDCPHRSVSLTPATRISLGFLPISPPSSVGSATTRPSLELENLRGQSHSQLRSTTGAGQAAAWSKNVKTETPASIAAIDLEAEGKAIATATPQQALQLGGSQQDAELTAAACVLPGKRARQAAGQSLAEQAMHVETGIAAVPAATSSPAESLALPEQTPAGECQGQQGLVRAPADSIDAKEVPTIKSTMQDANPIPAVQLVKSDASVSAPTCAIADGLVVQGDLLMKAGSEATPDIKDESEVASEGDMHLANPSVAIMTSVGSESGTPTSVAVAHGPEAEANGGWPAPDLGASRVWHKAGGHLCPADAAVPAGMRKLDEIRLATEYEMEMQLVDAFDDDTDDDNVYRFMLPMVIEEPEEDTGFGTRSFCGYLGAGVGDSAWDTPASLLGGKLLPSKNSINMNINRGEGPFTEPPWKIEQDDLPALKSATIPLSAAEMWALAAHNANTDSLLARALRSTKDERKRLSRYGPSRRCA